MQCVCGQRFICPAAAAILLRPHEASFEDESNGLSQLRKQRRQGLEAPVVIAIVLGVAVVTGVAVWATMPRANAKGVARETTAATVVPSGEVGVAPTGNAKPFSPPKATATGDRTAEDARKELRAAEETLATLNETYGRERARLISEALDKSTPDEFRELMRDMDSGKPVDVVLENDSRRNDEQDRGLAPENRLASINARTQRKKQFLEALNSLKGELEDPKSTLSLKLQRALEALDSTKELRKQERLVAVLRRDVPAGTTPSDPKTAAAAKPDHSSAETARSSADAAPAHAGNDDEANRFRRMSRDELAEEYRFSLETLKLEKEKADELRKQVSDDFSHALHGVLLLQTPKDLQKARERSESDAERSIRETEVKGMSPEEAARAHKQDEDEDKRFKEFSDKLVNDLGSGKRHEGMIDMATKDSDTAKLYAMQRDKVSRLRRRCDTLESMMRQNDRN